jgi:hypothetical protein
VEAGSLPKQSIVLTVLGAPDAANQAAAVRQGAATAGIDVQLKVATDAQYGSLFRDSSSPKGCELIQTTNYERDPDPLVMYNDVGFPNVISNCNSYDNPAASKC